MDPSSGTGGGPPDTEGHAGVNTFPGRSSGTELMLTGLLQASHLASLDKVPDLVGKHAKHAGLSEVLIYLVDLQQNVLRLLTGAAPGPVATVTGPDDAAGDDSGTDDQTEGHDGVDEGLAAAEYPCELRVDTTLAGRAFQEVRILAGHDADGGVRWRWVPLLDGTERLGVLRIRAEAGDKRSLDAMGHLASLVALLVTTKRAYSDTYARLVRTRPMHMAAEMEWTLMPPLTFVDDRVAIAAIMEPAYEVGGDAFDYALAGDMAHVGIFDAMGHDISAGLCASLAMAACRNNRRQGVGLAANTEAIEETLITQFGRGRFVTAILADLNLETGVLTWVNRGHHPPVLIRAGRWVNTLSCRPAHPMGLGLGVAVTLCREQLEPGDRVLLYTDGIIEARDSGGREFGLERLTDFFIRRAADGLPVPETLRRLVRTVLDYHDERLQDDATVLLIEWHGSADRDIRL